MSKYKTPFLNDVESSKALQNRTSKYRLPFQKDEPAEDLQKSLNNLTQQSIALQSDIKLPKLAISTELNKPHPPRKHKNQMGIHEEINMSVKSDRQQLHQSYNENILSYEGPRNEPQESKKSFRDVDQSQRTKQQSQTRPKLSIYNKKKRRFLSSASKYGDDQYADNTDQSEQELIPIKEKPRNIQKQLPIIGESNSQKQQREESDEDIRIWENLYKDIEQYQQNKQKQLLSKQKLKHKSSKRRKTLSKKIQRLQDNQILAIQTELKKSISKQKSHKRSRSYVDNPSFYQLLKPQNRLSPRQAIRPNIQEKQMKESQNMMQKLKEIITLRNEKLHKTTTKMPLQFYLNSYQQIKVINPFFRKLSQMQGCILLNIGKLTIFQANKSIYSEGDTCKELYIIIYGKIIISNKYKTLRKFALTGQTLGEEELFENEKSYIQRLKQHARPNLHRYDAKSLNKSCLLRIQLMKYYKMSCQLNRMGYKQQFNLIDNLFRINFINKQTNLHYNERERIHTESAMPRPALKHGAFFY